MFTAEEMRAEGLSDADIDRILARNEEIMKKRAAELPTTPEAIEEFLESMPLLAQRLPEAGKEGPEFEALRKLAEESTPIERAETLKESGNAAFQLGKKDTHRYRDALIFYSQALDALAGFDPWGNPIGPPKPATDISATTASSPSSSSSSTTVGEAKTVSKETKLESILLSNRALVHLTMESNGAAYNDAKKAVAVDATNSKAHYRVALAAQRNSKWQIAVDHCRLALALPLAAAERKATESLQLSVTASLEAQLKKDRERDARLAAEAEEERKRKSVVDAALRSRGIRVGPSEYNYRHYVEQAGKGSDLPRFDLNGDLLWPVLFLYPETQQSDFIAACNERSRLGDHIAEMFPPNAPYAPWDTQRRYRADNLQIYFESAGARAKKRSADTKRATSATRVDNVVQVDGEDRARVFVNPQSTLASILSKAQYGEVPGIPVFHIVPIK